MNPAALFAAHKGAVLGIAAAGVTGLALMKRKGGKAAPADAGAALPGSVAANGFMGPDSSAYDVYNALLPELDALRQTGGGPGTGINTAPAVVHSPLIANDAHLRDNPYTSKNARPIPRPTRAPRPPWFEPTPPASSTRGPWRMA